MFWMGGRGFVRPSSGSRWRRNGIPGKPRTWREAELVPAITAPQRNSQVNIGACARTVGCRDAGRGIREKRAFRPIWSSQFWVSTFPASDHLRHSKLRFSQDFVPRGTAAPGLSDRTQYLNLPICWPCSSGLSPSPLLTSTSALVVLTIHLFPTSSIIAE